MARRVFYSFHYELDNWRASQVRNMGIVLGNRPATGNRWEEIWRGGDRAIESWIQEQLLGKSCLVVLIGAETARRKWIDYEIVEGWTRGMGVLGVHVYRMKNRLGETCEKGENPFEGVVVDGTDLGDVVKTYDPAWFFGSSKDAYKTIEENLANWIEEAIDIRSDHD